MNRIPKTLILKAIRCLAVVLLLMINNVFGQKMSCYLDDLKGTPREHQLDLERMVLNVNFKPDSGKVNGKVTYYFSPIREQVDSIFFDAPKITIEDVKLNGVTAKFTTDDAGLTVFPANPLHWKTKDSIVITYNCIPRKGIYFIGWNTNANTIKKQIWTQGQGVDNRYWIPSYDDMDE